MNRQKPNKCNIRKFFLLVACCTISVAFLGYSFPSLRPTNFDPQFQISKASSSNDINAKPVFFFNRGRPPQKYNLTVHSTSDEWYSAMKMSNCLHNRWIYMIGDSNSLKITESWRKELQDRQFVKTRLRRLQSRICTIPSWRNQMVARQRRIL